MLNVVLVRSSTPPASIGPCCSSPVGGKTDLPRGGDKWGKQVSLRLCSKRYHLWDKPHRRPRVWGRWGIEIPRKPRCPLMSLRGGRERKERDRLNWQPGFYLQFSSFLITCCLTVRSSSISSLPSSLPHLLDTYYVSEPDIVIGAKARSVNRLDGGMTHRVYQWGLGLAATDT